MGEEKKSKKAKKMPHAKVPTVKSFESCHKGSWANQARRC
jgi:hypothetical protein